MKDYTEGHPNDKQFDDPRARIQSLMDHLQQCMEGQAHIDRPDYTSDLIDSIAKRWTALQEDEREYISAARYAMVNKMPWTV